MTLMKWNPRNGRMELNDLLNQTFGKHAFDHRRASSLNLSIDIYETEENLVLRAALPGAKKEDIQVEFEEQLLTVTATVNEPELPEGATSLLQESHYGTVTRSLRIPHSLDIENSKGNFTNGVLEVTFPKAPEARKKTITIE